jgi:hypothetical protein
MVQQAGQASGRHAINSSRVCRGGPTVGSIPTRGHPTRLYQESDPGRYLMSELVNALEGRNRPFVTMYGIWLFLSLICSVSGICTESMSPAH